MLPGKYVTQLTHTNTQYEVNDLIFIGRLVYKADNVGSKAEMHLIYLWLFGQCSAYFSW